MTITTDHPFTTEPPALEPDLGAPHPSDTPPPSRQRASGRSVLRWGAVLAAVGATAVLVAQVVDGNDEPARGITDAKDNPGWEPVSVGIVAATPGITDAKDNPGWNPGVVVAHSTRGITDAKDNPGWNPGVVVVQATRGITDAKDNPGWNPGVVVVVQADGLDDAKDHPGWGPFNAS